MNLPSLIVIQGWSMIIFTWTLISLQFGLFYCMLEARFILTFYQLAAEFSLPNVTRISWMSQNWWFTTSWVCVSWNEYVYIHCITWISADSICVSGCSFSLSVCWVSCIMHVYNWLSTWPKYSDALTMCKFGCACWRFSHYLADKFLFLFLLHV